jgi:hypothetical protein
MFANGLLNALCASSDSGRVEEEHDPIFSNKKMHWQVDHTVLLDVNRAFELEKNRSILPLKTFVRLNVPVKKEQCFVKRLYLRPVNAILH